MDKNIKHDLRYGGTIASIEEYNAIMDSVEDSIHTGNWQTGPICEEFEKQISNFIGTKYAVFTNSGSSAGLLALASLELPKNSEVIISAVTFPTIFNIILQCGLTPVVVDAKVGSYTFDVKEVEKAITKKTKAIIAIHPVGNPVDMPALMKVARKHGVYVIEDNCDGWGGEINGKKLGSFGDLSITSFHAAHIVSTMVGGAVFTNDKKLMQNVRMYKDWGRQADVSQRNRRHKMLPKDYNPRFIYEKIGYNLQPLELQAAMGLVQLKKSDQIKWQRKTNYEYFVKHLSKHEGLIMPKVVGGADPCWFALPLSVKDNRGKLVRWLEKHGVETRSMFSGNIILHPAYKDSKYRIGSKLLESNRILTDSFWIGVHPRLTQEDREYVVRVFDDYFKKTSTK